MRLDVLLIKALLCLRLILLFAMSIGLLPSADDFPVRHDLGKIGLWRFYFLEMATLVEHECARLLSHSLHFDSVGYLIVQIDAVLASK